MDERRAGDAAVTGVAKGSLGTGTALDETQEWVIPAQLQARPEPDLAAAAGASDLTAREHLPAARESAPAAPEPVLISPAPLAAVERPQVIAHPQARQGSAPSPRSTLGSPRTAGIAAAVLLALIGVAAVVTSVDRNDAGAAPQAPAQVTTAPTDPPPAEAGGNGGGDGGGKKDKGKGNGQGNGNGNENGNGRGN